MPLQMTNGSPRLSADQNRRMLLRRTSEKTIDFAASTTDTVELTRDLPIVFLDCIIEGNLNVSSTVALTGEAGYGLINQITVSRNGNDPIHFLRGQHLKYVDHIIAKHAPLAVDPTLTAGTTAFKYHFRLPLDIGGFTSLLDVSRDQSLEVRVDWNAYSGMYSAGAATVESGKLRIIPVVMDGARYGEIGGLEGGDLRYLRPFVLYQSKPVTGDQDDLMIELTAQRGYHGLTLLTYRDGVLADDIINSIILERANKRNFKIDRDDLKAYNFRDLRLAAETTFDGVYDLAFVLDNHPELNQSINATQSMNIILDVTKGGGTTVKTDLVASFLR